MLVDSEQLSFIYILDVDGDFLYLSFTKENWGGIKSSFNKKALPVYLHIEEKHVCHYFSLMKSYYTVFQILKKMQLR
ncbi:hypothetical protein KHA80_18325 [Anaerobacillus sp. HL2]|nr:hypothetical protein KHA80_18325 [Anaerobacillus sp. HL2]